MPHGSTIDVVCNENYELAYSLAPSLCYNGTWTNYPRCQPGEYLWPSSRRCGDLGEVPESFRCPKLVVRGLDVVSDSAEREREYLQRDFAKRQG